MMCQQNLRNIHMLKDGTVFQVGWFFRLSALYLEHESLFANCYIVSSGLGSNMDNKLYSLVHKIVNRS
jgi:hypothetical protein